MPKGKESQSRQKKNFNKIDLYEIKSSIKKMAEFATSTASSGQDSFIDNNAVATIPNQDDPMGDITAKEKQPVKIPNFKKKVNF